MAITAAPFVVYSSCNEAVVSAEDWPTLYASLQALKAHVQEYPGCEGFDVFFAEAAGAASYQIHCYTTWDTLAQLEAFLERGYTFERLISDVGGEIEVTRSLVMEKVF
jgi:antirestriction protein